MKEHTKPLFKSQSILCVQNLYFYHCFLEVFKVMKFHTPISLFEQYQQSRRSYLTHLQLLPPPPSTDFLYRSSIIWNTARQKLEITDLSISVSQVKNKLKQLLLLNQHKYHEVEWYPSHDFKI